MKTIESNWEKISDLLLIPYNTVTYEKIKTKINYSVENPNMINQHCI
jgi:hypothetical protein